MPRWFTLILAVSVSACGAASRPRVPGASGANGPASPPAGWLVWVDEDAPRTTWLDADGTPRGTRAGVIVAAGHALWALQMRTREMKLPTCDQIEHAAGEALAEPPGGETGHVTIAALVELGGTQRLVLDDGADPEEHALAALEQRTLVTAGLGPYVFVQQFRSWDACGAHGNSEARARVFDVETGTEVAVVAPEDEPFTETLRIEAAARLRAERPGTDDDETAPEVAFGEPAVGASGISMRYGFQVGTCYACGDGRWGSYTRLTTVPAAALPGRLQRHAAVPPGVQAWLASHPDARGVSEARVDPSPFFEPAR